MNTQQCNLANRFWNVFVQGLNLAKDRPTSLIWTEYTLGFLRRNIHTKDSSIREVTYKTVVHLILEYSLFGAPTPKLNIHKIEMVQRRAARWTLCRFSSYDSVSDMLGDLGWRSVEDMRTDSRLCLFYKIVHGLTATTICCAYSGVYKTFSITSVSI